MSRLFLSPPDVGPRERELLLDAFDSNWIAPLGPHVDGFEREFATFVEVADAAALSSGTAALHLALVLLGVGAGDDVLVPSLTFAATANAVAYVGARPVFLDSERATWNLDPQLVEEELASRAREGRPQPAAVIVVDLYGQCASWDPILAACAEHGVPVIEDAAEALGATYRGRPAGSFGALNVFSFNGNKIITTSGGGMLAGDDPALIGRARHLATQARDPSPHYEHSEIGFNYRMSNLLAALGRAQLEGLPAKVARRRAVNAAYRDALADVPGVGFLPNAPEGEPTNWLTVITVDDPTPVREHLDSIDIEARPAWKPMHLQPVFADCEMRGGAVAEEIFRHGLCLPSGSSMTDADVARVVDGVRAVLVRGMTTSVISLDDPAPVRALIDAYLDGRDELTGLELYYALERATSLLSFHTMLRGGPRNRERNGLQQSYGDHNRLLMLGLDQLIAGDLDWYRERLDPADPVPDDALRRCFASVAALDLPREALVACWLAAALHDCGMLCGRGAYVDVEDGVPLSRPIIEALGPSELHDLATFALHHHDYIKGVFLGEVPAALVADDLEQLPGSQRRVALAALGCVQVAGAASLGEGRLGPQRVEIFDRCFDGTALDDRTRSTRVARLLGAGAGADADVALDPALDGFLDSAAVHGWQRITGRLGLADRTALLGEVATWWTESGADHVVFADGVDAWTAVPDREQVPRHVETALSGVSVLVVDR